MGTTPTSGKTSVTAHLQAEMLTMNEALVVGSVRQHELTEVAELSNGLLQKEIADRKLVEAALRESEVRYRTLFDLGPMAVYSCNASGVIQNFNRRAAELWGRKPVTGDTNERFCGSFKMFRPDGTSIPHKRCPMVEVLSGKIPGVHGAEVIIERPGGSRVICAVDIQPLKNKQGKVTGAINCFYDITERKQAEAARRRVEVLAATNWKLELEISQRHAVEKALKRSEKYKGQLLTQSRLMEKQLRHLSHDILLAQEEERKRISRELHDVIAQTLTSINLRLAAFKTDATLDPKNLAKAVSHTQELVQHSVNIVHRFAQELRPSVLDDLGLIPALHTFLKGFKSETGIHATLSAFAGVDQMSSDKRIVFYRVAQEALTNVARHSHASRVEVRIHKRAGAACMTVKDNGTGFPGGRLSEAKKKNRLGLLGMRERLEMVGGEFAIESVLGQGTIVTAEIPLDGSRRKAARL
jgi:PAS domain S-box-containing protein